MAADHGETLSDRPPAQFTDDAWIEVLSAMDRTCADLVSAQERLERQNAELQHRRTFLTAILSSVSDLLIVADRTGRVVQVSRSVAVLSGRHRRPDRPPAGRDVRLRGTCDACGDPA